MDAKVATHTQSHAGRKKTDGERTSAIMLQPCRDCLEDLLCLLARKAKDTTSVDYIVETMRVADSLFGPLQGRCYADLASCCIRLSPSRASDGAWAMDRISDSSLSAFSEVLANVSLALFQCNDAISGSRLLERYRKSGKVPSKRLLDVALIGIAKTFSSAKNHRPQTTVSSARGQKRLPKMMLAPREMYREWGSQESMASDVTRGLLLSALVSQRRIEEASVCFLEFHENGLRVTPQGLLSLVRGVRSLSLAPGSSKKDSARVVEVAFRKAKRALSRHNNQGSLPALISLKKCAPFR